MHKKTGKNVKPCAKPMFPEMPCMMRVEKNIQASVQLALLLSICLSTLFQLLISFVNRLTMNFVCWCLCLNGQECVFDVLEGLK